MADPELLHLLKEEHVEAWIEWRRQENIVWPDLIRANLSEVIARIAICPPLGPLTN